MIKILYIPADNISANFSRSFHISKNLSSHCKLYRVRWYDNRSAFWEGKKSKTLNSFKCFLKSLVRSTKIEKSTEFGYDVNTSVFISAFIGRLIGKYNAFNLMHKYNLISLNRIVKKIQPDIIFHADGFYFFPALNNNIKEFSDLQDDINWTNFPSNKLDKIFEYYTENFNHCNENFIVSESAKVSLQKFIKTDFTSLNNGASFEDIENISDTEINSFKKNHQIPKDHKIISYIGGEHKYDSSFAINLAKKIENKAPNFTLVLAGNLPIIESKNIIYTGILNNKDANILYRLTDVGITLKNTKNNNFIFNSVPLKFVQYAAAQKPIISFPIKWSCENNFPNIKHIETEDLNVWVNEINSFINNFEWIESYSEIWRDYDWKNIISKLYIRIT